MIKRNKNRDYSDMDNDFRKNIDSDSMIGFYVTYTYESRFNGTTKDVWCKLLTLKDYDNEKDLQLNSNGEFWRFNEFHKSSSNKKTVIRTGLIEIPANEWNCQSYAEQLLL